MSNVKQYRKKPVVIEAMQLQGNSEQVMKWLTDNKCGASWELDSGLPVYIETLEGIMTANQGDYIIKGVNGEFYPCKPDIFEKTYEAA